MPSRRTAASANGKRKETAEISSDGEYRSSTTSSKSKKRQKVDTTIETASSNNSEVHKDKSNVPTTTVVIELPTKALNDILQKGATKATQKNIRDIIAMIHAQKALIASQVPVSDEFNIIAYREGSEWSGHFRVRGVHKLYELAKVVATTSRTNVQGMSFKLNAEDQKYSVGDEEDRNCTLKELGLGEGDKIAFTVDDKKHQDFSRASSPV